MTKNVTLAVAQIAPVFLDKKKTVQKACKAIIEAGEKGAELIVFPEAFISGYPDWVWLIPNSKGADLNELYVKLVENSVSVPDDATRKLCEAAKKAKIHVVMGMHERNSETSGASLFNSLLFIDNQGLIVGKHRKLIPTQILATPTWDKSPNWLQSMQHIAREGGLFVVSACMAIKIDDIPDEYEFKKLYPEGREWINVGNSAIIAPNGQILAGPLEAEEGILYAEVDLDQIIKAKRMFDAVGHYSRPDVFRSGIHNIPDKG